MKVVELSGKETDAIDREIDEDIAEKNAKENEVEGFNELEEKIAIPESHRNTSLKKSLAMRRTFKRLMVQRMNVGNAEKARMARSG